MLNIYKIKAVDSPMQSPEDVEENGGMLYIIDVKTDMKNDIMQDTMFAEDGGYDGGWPMGFSFTEEWGIRVGELCPDLFDVYTNRNASNIVTRQLYVVVPDGVVPEVGEYCAFMNQYDKRITNEEITELLQQLHETEQDADILQYEIGSDDKLTKVTNNG